MARRGCISIRHLALQILLRENPLWRGTPVAVTREEKPRSPILALNREARDRGLTIGTRYANALSLVPSLRARAVPLAKVAEARDRIVRVLSSFTPDIEPCPFDADAAWVSVEGLGSLFASESRWIQSLRDALAVEGFPATVALGFTRFGTYALARSRPRSVVFASPEEEQVVMCRSPIDILPLSPRIKGTLRKLEIRTLGQFVSLPEGEITQRFGKEAGRLRQAILSDDPLPIQSVSQKEAVRCWRHLDSPLTDLALLMPHIEELLAQEAARVESDKSVISALSVTLRTEDGEVATDVIRPAAPTLRKALLLRLIQLRLSARQLTSGVEDLEIRADRTAPSRKQEELFTVRGRDLQAGARAFAAIRARFGNQSVTFAQRADSHVPERSFRWLPLERPALPSAGRTESSPAESPIAVRRILFRPVPSRPDSGARPLTSSFVLSVGWWAAGEDQTAFHRSYSFQSSEAGLMWCFVDRRTDTCWIQGSVD